MPYTTFDNISLFLTEMQKRQPGEMDLPLLKNDITTFEGHFQIQDT